MISRRSTGSTSQHPRRVAGRREARATGIDWRTDGGRPEALDGSARTPGSAASADPPQRLAAEHELLLHAVIARADEVLVTLAATQWPEHEVAELIRYLQTEVIPQTRMEEELLFTRVGGQSDADFARLVRDHVRIRYALEALTDVARDRDHGTRRLLPATVRDLVAHLAQHLRQERAVLSRHTTGMGWQRALAAMEEGPHAWYSLIYAPVLDLDAFSQGQVIDVVWPRVQGLRPDEQIVVVSRRDMRVLCAHLLRDENVAVHYLDDGPETWRVSVRRRRLQ